MNEKFQLRNRITILAGIVILLGTISRLIYWQTYPLKWKLHAVFNPIEFGTINYISDFSGYAPTRLPFFDVFSAGFYIFFSPLVGVKALSSFNLVISIASLFFFYFAVSKLFNRKLGLFSTIMYSLYPKSSQLAAVGFPEASSIGFISFCFYVSSIIMKSEDNSLFIYGVLGVLILLSWLIYIPAVVFGVIFSMYLFFTLRSDESGLLSTLIDPRYWLVVSPSGLVGILYLIFGPIQRIRNTTSSTYLSEPTLFIEAEAYGITQKIVRYVSYTYFDFWWHRSGFDLEASILPLYKGLNQFLGPFFEVYLAGFALVTSIISIVIIYGIYLSIKNIDRFKLFLLSTILIFAVIWNLKNIGWRGTFQTRHVFPVFPVLCIMFGFGAFNCTKFIASKIGEDPNLPINTDSLVSTLLIMLFIVLLINGGVHGVIRGEKYEIGREDPANQLEHIVEKDDSVGIVQGRLYRSTILYTEAAVRPVMLVESDLQREEFMKFSPYADTRVTNFSNPDLNDIDYLYIKSGCGDISGKRQQVLDYAVQSGGEIVYETHKERNGFRCSSINVYIISV